MQYIIIRLVTTNYNLCLHAIYLADSSDVQSTLVCAVSSQ